ncbi:unnamed protein product [Adineta steineri]|uniref:Uncharacterized protein n=1 Tax=Adineta steineri TaxID=433720 RepID=A0A819EPX4_9BILA|nr:unnamed protein product [Adineta steineri]
MIELTEQTTTKILSFYAKYFCIKYLLTTIDRIAIVDFGFDFSVGVNHVNCSHYMLDALTHSDHVNYIDYTTSSSHAPSHFIIKEGVEEVRKFHVDHPNQYSSTCS